jgi:imidazolonepropionase-like amidohydrolase
LSTVVCADANNGDALVARDRRSLSIPAGATEIDARGRWIVPGFLHTNVDLMDDFIAQDGGEEFSIVGSCSM